jgi:hypothetical protein
MQDREPTRMNWRRYLPDESPQSSIPIELWKCDGSPPSRKTAQVTRLCTIDSKLPPFSELPIYRNEAGKCFRIVQFDLLLTLQGTSLEWSVWINNEKQGEKSVGIVYN